MPSFVRHLIPLKDLVDVTVRKKCGPVRDLKGLLVVVSHIEHGPVPGYVLQALDGNGHAGQLQDEPEHAADDPQAPVLFCAAVSLPHQRQNPQNRDT